MKKICIYLIVIMLLLGGCGTPYQENLNYEKTLSDGYFVEINHFDSFENGINMTYKIVYAKDTKVKYLVASGYYRYAITPLYNPDGTLQIYEK